MQGYLHDPVSFAIGTYANLKTDSNTVVGIHVSSIYVMSSWTTYVETGFATDVDRQLLRRSFMAYGEPYTTNGQVQVIDGTPSLPWGVWRYFEINRFSSKPGGRWEWRANVAGTVVKQTAPMLMSAGTSFVSSERELHPQDTNYLSSSNVCYRGTNGSWYMFNEPRVRYSPTGDPGYLGQWGSWWSGKRDFQVSEY